MRHVHSKISSTPTDWDLLYKGVKITQENIDYMHQPMIGKAVKPKANREIARETFLNLSKNKKKTTSKIRKVIRYLLECLIHGSRFDSYGQSRLEVFCERKVWR